MLKNVSEQEWFSDQYYDWVLAVNFSIEVNEILASWGDAMSYIACQAQQERHAGVKLHLLGRAALSPTLQDVACFSTKGQAINRSLIVDV